ncbi:hypothetical protein FQR65_LT00388 [Abscondita terminalis]|nr:hypothetical protein FQR65_LT00388 [Abscondita terminalis]
MLETMLTVSQVADSLGDCYEQKLEKFQEDLSIESVQYYEEVKMFIEKIRDEIKIPKSYNPLQKRKLQSSFQEAHKIIKDISTIVQENSIITEQYQSLTLEKLNSS